MSAPYGNEVLKVVASTEPFTDANDTDWANELFKEIIGADLSLLATRGIDVRKTTAKQGATALFYSVRAKS